ncbi:DNA polymerase III subunit delta [Palleronia sp. LCG004]|uniref:DNA polymerase III subunit delta n=1 Tax=Palleronia sp. LCG004 TaxID=3079304 RepID=UPI002943A1C5|nr:DNA polymerase III subunit delta [Palleronia sp. LCG004]WOI55542.1 DNA polymerase III subunit delta [Palleronia sp. LCG004]
MKLARSDAAAWIAKPPEDRPGTLLYGEDAMRVALKRQDLVRALIGPKGDEEMRLERISPSDLTAEKGALVDAIKAQGFFPGPRAILVEDATNSHAKPILDALGEWRPGDAHIVVTARALKPASQLRKGFEGHRAAASIGIYDEPMDASEIRAALERAGLSGLDRDAEGVLRGFAATLDPGDFRQLLEKIALYKSGDETPLTEAEIALCAPASTEAETDEIVALVADGHADRIGPIMNRLWAQGAQPVALCIAAERHFRTLLSAAADPGGPGTGVGKLRPPVYGPRRDAILRQAQRWGVLRLEQAMRLLTETDLTLRSSARAPHMAVLERAFIRLAMMGGR